MTLTHTCAVCDVTGDLGLRLEIAPTPNTTTPDDCDVRRSRERSARMSVPVVDQHHAAVNRSHLRGAGRSVGGGLGGCLVAPGASGQEFGCVNER
jgi:hypothetical protein